ncbi:hypothetical protein F8A87_07750 [Betaproteobacteria bacterium SCN2]|nr:hypothetical protein F8A87_07750 [Betaproteobacteria bacterium SCN2]
MIVNFFVSVTVTAPKVDNDALKEEIRGLEIATSFKEGGFYCQDIESEEMVPELSDLFLDIEGVHFNKDFTFNSELRQALLNYKSRLGENCSIYVLYTFAHDGQANLFFEKKFIEEISLLADSLGITTYESTLQ